MARGGYNPKRNAKPKPCKYCGTSFVPYNSSAVACSDNCRKIGLRKAKERHKAKEDYQERHRNQTRESRKRNPDSRLLSSVKSRDKDTDLTREWIKERIDRGFCEATGIPFDLSYGCCGSNIMKNISPFSPSIDKIDPDGGYKKTNCRVVCFVFNRAKAVYSDDVMIKMAKGILDTLGDYDV